MSRYQRINKIIYGERKAKKDWEVFVEEVMSWPEDDQYTFFDAMRRGIKGRPLPDVLNMEWVGALDPECIRMMCGLAEQHGMDRGNSYMKSLLIIRRHLDERKDA